jgi:3-deoxy-D-manno-octulosonic-acid transferase
MWTLVYPLLLVFAYPLVRLRLRLRARREPAYAERIPERFGHAPPGIPKGCAWFHTVSAGETIAAAPLIAELVSAYPQVPCLVTTMTPAGSEQVRARLGTAVHHCYAPYDFPSAVRRFFDAVQPRVLVLMETELWPNLIAAAAARGVPVVLVNARLSARSARGYRRLGALTRNMLSRLSTIACQYPDHAERFLALGAPLARVVVTGSVKFDLALPVDHATRVAALRERWQLGAGPVWIAGSTHPGEDEQVLAAHAEILGRLPGTRLILAPRHPARTPDLLALCRARGFSVGRHGAADPADATAGIVLIDAMGVLLDYYALADVAFVGGSFVPVGGHNPIEPALCGVPVVMGPQVFNFADVVEAFRGARALEIADGPDALANVVAAWLADPAERVSAGARARAVVVANTGATARLRGVLAAEFEKLRAGRD